MCENSTGADKYDYTSDGTPARNPRWRLSPIRRQAFVFLHASSPLVAAPRSKGRNPRNMSENLYRLNGEERVLHFETWRLFDGEK